MNTVKVECLPTDLPPQLTVDVCGLRRSTTASPSPTSPCRRGSTLPSAEPSEVVVKVAALRVREEAEEARAEAGRGRRGLSRPGRPRRAGNDPAVSLQRAHRR